MSDTERLILLNQYVIMAFLHGVHLKDVSYYNTKTFESMQQQIKTTEKTLRKEVADGGV